jgi:hypothetical protein
MTRARNLGVAPALFLLFQMAAIAQDGAPGSVLELQPEDVRIEQSIEGGYYLYVRKKPGIESILITESTEAQDHSVATYALRNPDYHPENGDERRRLDGEFLETDGIYSLLDSTTAPDEEFGRAFSIFIPYVVVYGYEWSRHGSLQVLDGTYLSVRTFELPYADYEGRYRDNPFVLRVLQKARVAEDSAHMDEAVTELAKVAEQNNGTTFASLTDEDAVARISALLSDLPGPTIDLVLALDTTRSMEDNIPYLQQNLVSAVQEQVRDRAQVRIGVVYYRDYMEEYLTRRSDFSDDLALLQRAVDTIRVAGGRDIPEAVNEALYTAVTRYYWQADDRLVILVGDAPPHPLPRGAVTPELVREAAEKSGVSIHTIILPQ